MDLSSVATEGISLCGDSSRVGDRAFRSLVQVTLDILLKKKNEESLTGEHVTVASWFYSASFSFVVSS